MASATQQTNSSGNGGEIIATRAVTIGSDGAAMYDSAHSGIACDGRSEGMMSAEADLLSDHDVDEHSTASEYEQRFRAMLQHAQAALTRAHTRGARNNAAARAEVKVAVQQAQYAAMMLAAAAASSEHSHAPPQHEASMHTPVGHAAGIHNNKLAPQHAATSQDLHATTAVHSNGTAATTDDLSRFGPQTVRHGNGGDGGAAQYGAGECATDVDARIVVDLLVQSDAHVRLRLTTQHAVQSTLQEHSGSRAASGMQHTAVDVQQQEYQLVEEAACAALSLESNHHPPHVGGEDAVPHAASQHGAARTARDLHEVTFQSGASPPSAFAAESGSAAADAAMDADASAKVVITVLPSASGTDAAAFDDVKATMPSQPLSSTDAAAATAHHAVM